MVNKFLSKQSDYFKSIVTLISGTAISQAIPILVSPILTRLYTPEDFGVFALFFSISVILGSIANARYEHAVMLPKKDADAINILALGLLISSILFFILLLLVFAFDDLFISTFEYEEMSTWIYIIPFAVFFIGFFNVLNYFNNRKKNYKDISTALVFKSLILVIVQVFFGITNISSIGLILGELFSRVFANYKLLKNVIKDQSLTSSISFFKIFACARKYKKFPIYNLPSTLANTLASYLPFLLLPKIFGLSIGGHFMLAQNLISIPSSIIAKSFSQVLFQKMAENRIKKIDNLPLLLITIKKLITIGLPISIFIYLLSPILFSYVFGKDWIIAGEIASLLSLVFFVTFVTSTVSVSLLVYSELEILARWQYIYLFSSILLFTSFFYFDFNLNEFLFYFICHEVILYLIYLFIIIRTVLKMDKLKVSND